MQSNVMIYAQIRTVIIHCYNYVVQIAGFGMSRDLIDENYYMTPVKRTAPEVRRYIAKIVSLEYIRARSTDPYHLHVCIYF